MSYDDFCRLSYEEFAAICEAYAEQRNALYKDQWERMRLLATIVIQPHLGRRHKVTPEKLLPFPWDKKTKPHKAGKAMTAQQQRARMEELVKKLGDELI